MTGTSRSLSSSAGVFEAGGALTKSRRTGESGHRSLRARAKAMNSMTRQPACALLRKARCSGLCPAAFSPLASSAREPVRPRRSKSVAGLC